MSSAISAKEALFCEYYKILRNPREAAAKAGYSFPEVSGMKLLKKRKILDEISERCEEISGESADGFRRVAFGSIADAIYLCTCCESLSKEQLERLDLFMVSEIKFQKGGGMEVKFLDRIKALDALSALQSSTDGSSAEPFYRALCEGAKNLSASFGDNNGV